MFGKRVVPRLILKDIPTRRTPIGKEIQQVILQYISGLIGNSVGLKNVPNVVLPEEYIGRIKVISI